MATQRSVKLMERDIQKVAAEMRALAGNGIITKGDQRAMAKPAAKIARDMQRSLVPKWTQAGTSWDKSLGGKKGVHVRYNSAGEVVAAYSRGNLQKSIKTKAWRQSRAMFVLPSAKPPGKGAGAFGHRAGSVDGFYFQFVDEGTRTHTLKIHVVDSSGNRTGKVYDRTWSGITPKNILQKTITRRGQAMKDSMYREWQKRLPQIMAKARAKAKA